MRKNCIIVLFLLLAAFNLPGRQKVFSQSSSFIAPVPFSYQEHWLFLEPGDTVNGVWNHISSLQMPLFGVAAYYLENVNKVFICGGIDSLDNPKTNCYLYDIQTNTYEPRASLPTGRAYGKLVIVRDSLYLAGSVSNFNIPDGALYKYDPAADQWQIKSPVTNPAVHEMGVCVWQDSLIIAIGGSTGGFSGALNTVQAYNPFTNTWLVLSGTQNIFPVNITTPQAECIGDEILLVGGLNSSVPYNKVFRGYIDSGDIEKLYWEEDTLLTPFGTGVYRLGGGKFGNYIVFGPALSATSCINQIWGFDVFSNKWTRFLPNTLDVASRTNIAVKHTADSLYFYLFGGITRDTAGIHFISNSEKYSTGNPVIGIAGNINAIPDKFDLKQNYPNPFNPSTTIEYFVPRRSFVTIKVFDIIGREITILVNEIKNAGNYKISFESKNLTSGVYFYSLISEDFVKTGKMILIK
jgi:N-acetylneuraminic acid mutarotase